MPFADAPDAGAYEEPPQMESAAGQPDLIRSSRCPRLLRTMRGAKASPLLAMPQTHAETESYGLSAHATAMGGIIVLSYRRGNCWFHCLQFRQPLGQRLARAECLEATRW